MTGIIWHKDTDTVLRVDQCLLASVPDDVRDPKRWIKENNPSTFRFPDDFPGDPDDIDRRAKLMAESVALLWDALPDKPDAVCGHGMPEGCKEYWRDLAQLTFVPNIPPVGPNENGYDSQYPMVSAAERECLEETSLEMRLLKKSTGSCSCGVKSPELEHHDPMCLYRLLSESIDAVTEKKDKS